ncbi:hypothetical protein RD110_08125 [Rhodoferax koreense]|uniref:Uncharacterized protein n=1 Tax=Rhodoferax koreensis TaxID=1842727 RepID=A0A1P8JTR6_9BURK|nr:hypothetical protein [Rhodoferax koreense]APW37170.1 hypothetical protein RD110_08125 [Rhodoferax koreense]
MQPTPYTPSTNFAQDERANVGGRSTVRTDRVDAEFDAIEVSISDIERNLALIQRDDGKLLDALVEPYNLSATTKAFVQATKWNARGLWATLTAYAVNDMVDVSGASYICAVAHVSGNFAADYAAGKWQVFVTANNAAAQAFAPTATISSTNTQAAVVEVDAAARAASLPALSAFYGGF